MISLQEGGFVRGLLVLRGLAFMHITRDRSTSSHDEPVHESDSAPWMCSTVVKLVPFCAFRVSITCWFRGPQLSMPYVPESGVFHYWFFVVGCQYFFLSRDIYWYIFYVRLIQNLCVCVYVCILYRCLFCLYACTSAVNCWCVHIYLRLYVWMCVWVGIYACGCAHVYIIHMCRPVCMSIYLL